MPPATRTTATRAADNEPTPIRPPQPARRSPVATTGSHGSAAAAAARTPAPPVGGPDDGARPPSLGSIVRRLGLAAVGIVVLARHPAGERRDRPLDRHHLVPVRRLRERPVDAARGAARAVPRRARDRARRAARDAVARRPPRAARGPDPARAAQDLVRPPAGRAASRRAQRPAGRRAGAARTGRDRRPARRSCSSRTTCPTSSRSAPGSWRCSRSSSRSASRAPSAGSWDTILLYLNGVPFSPTASVTDPVFGRDIGFFLFDLPFLRFVQALINGLLLAALAVAGARYLLATTRGGEVFVTRVRVHLAVIAGLYLLSVAFGYQLDKYELVYSQAGVATGVALRGRQRAVLRLRRPHAAVGPRRRAARRRRVHPLAVAAGRRRRDLVRRLDPPRAPLPGGDPALQRRPQHVRPGGAVHREQHRDDAARLRHRRLGEPPLRRDGAADAGGDRERGGHVHQRPPVGLPAAPDDPRPGPERPPVLRLRRRRHRPLRHRRHAAPGDAVRPRARDRAQPAGRRAGSTSGSSTPTASASRWSRSTRSRTEGQPRLWVRDLPPRRRTRAPEIIQPRIYFGEADAHYVVVARQAARVRLPARHERGRRRRDDVVDRRHGRPARLDPQPAAVRAPVPGPRPADLGPGHGRQPAAVPPDDGRPAAADRAVPALRQGPVPRRRRRGHLVYVQDAYTISDQFPHATVVQHGRSWARSRACAGTRSTTSGTASRSRWTRTTGRCTSTSPTRRTRSSAPGRASSRRCSSRWTSWPTACSSHLRVPEEQFNVQTRVYGQYHVDDPLTFFNRTDRWTVPDEADEPAEPRVRGVLRRDADARRAEGGVPAAPADDRRQPAEHDRVGGRPQRRPRTTARSAPTGSRPTRRSSGRRRSRRGSTRTR